MSLSHSAPEHIAKLQQLYIASMPTKHSEVTTNWVLAEQQNWQGESVKNLLRMIHHLSHTAASFGFADIGAMACDVEFLLLGGIVAENLSEIRHKLQALCGLLTVHASTNEPHKKPLVPATWLQQSPHKKILIVDSSLYLNRFVDPLEKAGYLVEISNNINTLQTYAETQVPNVIILDGTFDTQVSPLFSEAVRLLNTQFPDAPILYIFRVNDFANRLQAVRLGAKHYLTQPVTAHQILESVENLLELHPQEPYRVLILEEDPDLAQLYQTSLEQAAIHSELLIDPNCFINALVEFKPDTILLDSTQAQCSALELAAVLRQEEAYAHINLLFLSADPQQNLPLWSLGNDQILTKPIPLSYLVELILHKARASRKLQQDLSHDKLTGLLNEHSFRERLQANIALAERSGSPVMVAVLDLIQFKEINLQRGYWVGNQVLKNIAKMLRQRLRRGDLIGRSQANQFLIALYDADETSSVQVLQQLLPEISDLPALMGESLHLQWSVGIAHYPGHIHKYNELSLDMLAVAANALQTAKQQGDHQFVLQSITPHDFFNTL
ncbi:MAG: diguanylate cyclase [Thiotrichaceae bacterium]|nr:diguanylate cyclase [Thiotrichaceae bacterium]